VTSRSRFVFDTSVLVSAAIFRRSIPREALTQAVNFGQVVATTQTLEELLEVLQRRKLAKYLTDHERVQFISDLAVVVETVVVTHAVHDCRDAKDNKILEAALSGNAGFIVTGDMDLLTLHPYRGIDILTPQMFLQHVGQTPTG